MTIVRTRERQPHPAPPAHPHFGDALLAIAPQSKVLFHHVDLRPFVGEQPFERLDRCVAAAEHVERDEPPLDVRAQPRRFAQLDRLTRQNRRLPDGEDLVRLTGAGADGLVDDELSLNRPRRIGKDPRDRRCARRAVFLQTGAHPVPRCVEARQRLTVRGRDEADDAGTAQAAGLVLDRQLAPDNPVPAFPDERGPRRLGGIFDDIDVHAIAIDGQRLVEAQIERRRDVAHWNERHERAARPDRSVGAILVGEVVERQDVLRMERPVRPRVSELERG